MTTPAGPDPDPVGELAAWIRVKLPELARGAAAAVTRLGLGVAACSAALAARLSRHDDK